VAFHHLTDMDERVESTGALAALQFVRLGRRPWLGLRNNAGAPTSRHADEPIGTHLAELLEASVISGTRGD
jgi:hypothetical protein